MKLKITMVEGTPQADDSDIRIVDTGRVTIGRGDECTWSLPDPDRALSKKHCEVMFQGTVFVLKDTSTNGVFMNDADEPVGRGKTVVLKNGDTFRAADFVFRADLVGDEVNPFAAPETPSAPATSADRSGRGERVFVDPGSPLESKTFGGNEKDPFDAFAGSFDESDDGSGGDGDVLSRATSGGWSGSDGDADFGGGWNDDWSAADGGEGFDSGSQDGFFGASGPEGGGFDAFSAPEPAGADDWSDPVAPLESPMDPGLAPTEPAWGGGDPGSPASGAGDPDARSAALAAVLVEALLTAGRHHEAIAGRLGIGFGKDQMDLPAVSGESLVAHLLKLPDDQGIAMARGLGRAIVSQAETIAQSLEAGGGRPGDGESGASVAADPFAADPFSQDD